MENNLNAAHRSRMREKCIEFGVSGFKDHELLEMLLFYAIPRVNTNPIAHELLNSFGSLNNVMTASIDDLKTINGIGDNSAIFINIINEIIRRCNRNELSYEDKFDKISKLGNYFIKLYDREIHEKFYIMMLDNSMRLISTELISEGNVNGTSVNHKKVLEKVLSRNASAVVAAHNHPNGEAYPSAEDLQSTKNIERLLALVGVRFIDHIIVAGREFTAIAHTEQYLRYDKDTYCDFHSDIELPKDFYNS